ncbi:MAG: Kelch repeat-containing protein, partial [Arenimonas sp.]
CGDAARFNASTNTWRSAALPPPGDGPPSARKAPTVAGSGTDLFVWGGATPDTNVGLADGRIYDSTTDTWEPIASTNAPSARLGAFGVFANGKFLVWGGENSAHTAYADGKAYDPVAGTWTSLPAWPLGAARNLMAVAWDGTSLVAFGGDNGGHGVFYGDGARFTPANNSWSVLPTLGAPSARGVAQVAANSGKTFIWRGIDNSDAGGPVDGAIYDSATNTWTAVPANGSFPASRDTSYFHSAVWLGDRFGVLRHDTPDVLYRLDDPATGQWSVRGATSAAPDGSVGKGRVALWTGQNLLVWGNQDFPGPMHNGWLFRPAADRWSETPETNAPLADEGVSMARVGAMTAVWGGDGPNQSSFNSGSLWHEDTRSGPLFADVQMSAQVTPVSPGRLVTFTLVASNAGPEIATGVDVRLELGDAFNVVSYPSAPECQLDTSGKVIRCSVEALAPGATYTMPATASVSPEVTATAIASAFGGGAETDTDTSNNVHSFVMPRLNLGDAQVVEGDAGTKQLVYTATLDGVASAPVTFTAATDASGTATAGGDFVALSQGGVIPAGQTSTTIAVTINGDATVETNETIGLQLSGVANANPVDLAATGTIVNDDGPRISINDMSINEGDSGTKLMTFTISLSQASAAPVHVRVDSAPGTASHIELDFVQVGATVVSIPAGQVSKAFSVTVRGDTTIEPTENFYLNLSNPNGGAILDGQGIGYIINDDGPVILINDVAVGEGASGTKLMTFTVSLSEISAGPVSYSISTSGGDATAGNDYVALNLTNQVIPAGQQSKTHSVTINGDATIEPTEAFFINVRQPTGASVWDGQGIGYILNDDGPTLSVPDASVGEGNSGTKVMNVTVSLSQVASEPVTFSIATANVSARAGSDYTAINLVDQVIPAGQLSTVFPSTVRGETAVEANASFTVTLG